MEFETAVAADFDAFIALAAQVEDLFGARSPSLGSTAYVLSDDGAPRDWVYVWIPTKR